MIVYKSILKKKKISTKAYIRTKHKVFFMSPQLQLYCNGGRIHRILL